MDSVGTMYMFMCGTIIIPKRSQTYSSVIVHPEMKTNLTETVNNFIFMKDTEGTEDDLSHGYKDK